MPKLRKKIELLAPAGSLEKLKYAIHYGADAVYAGLPDLSMRARINSFNEKTLKEATDFVHKNGKKIFITLNIYAHNYHLEKMKKHLSILKKIKVDGIIVSDPGILMLVKKYLPKMEIHLSTQANTTNWQAAKFWYNLGVKRVVLAREVTLEDIREIHKKVPKLELEYFVHGAMCMSYSGRCILSKWMTGTSANLGDCSQPCRWAYHPKLQIEDDKLKIKSKLEDKKLSVLSHQSSEFRTMEVEDIRGEHKVELEEDRHGTYFFNSKDLNLLEYLSELRDAGVMSFKIEGRNKSVSYVANVVRAYRIVLDALEKNISQKEFKKVVKKQSLELDKIMNRGYTKGFLLGYEPEHNFYQSHSEGRFQFVGEVLNVNGKELTVKAHNVIYTDDELEIVGKEKITKVKIKKIFNDKLEEVNSAHGGHGKLYKLMIDKSGVDEFSLLRKIMK